VELSARRWTHEAKLGTAWMVAVSVGQPHPPRLGWPRRRCQAAGKQGSSERPCVRTADQNGEQPREHRPAEPEQQDAGQCGDGDGCGRRRGCGCGRGQDVHQPLRRPIADSMRSTDGLVGEREQAWQRDGRPPTGARRFPFGRDRSTSVPRSTARCAGSMSSGSTCASCSARSGGERRGRRVRLSVDDLAGFDALPAPRGDRY
jgi:hypothetical protein